ATYKRYGGTTFVIAGRTHDPSIMAKIRSPRKSRDQANPGYIGYLWKGTNDGRLPHEALPLDFTPAQFHYPADWKQMYGTKGFVIAMHVPASFASKKNALSRALYREGKTQDPKAQWLFLERLRKHGFEATKEGLPPMPKDSMAG
ncbi:MAG TPA: hypothetical protein VFA15_09425, partial [Nitrososphaera sp.]|nr:hypothetical protein [Nitrososphaera sp.]